MVLLLWMRPDGLSNEKHIAIDSKDLKGSELDSELDPVIVIGNSGTFDEDQYYWQLDVED